MSGPKGKITVRGMPGVEFDFNPHEYSVTKTAEWKRSTTKDTSAVAMAEYVGPGPRAMTIEVFLDSGSNPKTDVGASVEALLALCVPLPTEHASSKPLPPFVVFGWGNQHRFVACVKQVTAKFTLFRSDGVPLRATCQVTLEEIPIPVPPQNPTSGGRRDVRGHTVVAGDSLASIAYDAYGATRRWRDVAEANAIDDPLRLPAGTRLLLPVD